MGPSIAAFRLGDRSAPPWHVVGKLGASSLVLPRLFLIDNFFASASISSISFETGPSLGSDHLPILATLALP